MTATTHTSPARRYVETWAAGDREALAALVADDVDFAGPMSSARGREEYLDTVMPFAQRLSGLRVLHEAGDDDDTVVIYLMDTEEFGTIPVAEHLRFTGGRMAWSRLIFDSWPIRSATG
jgi:hypothetical protein